MNRDIWVIPAAGGTATQITIDMDYDRWPAWSPDGSNIAFESERSGNSDIGVISATGGTATQITTHPGFDSAPAWSPDGNQIAFSSDRSGNGDIWVIPAPASVAVDKESWGSIKGRYKNQATHDEGKDDILHRQ